VWIDFFHGALSGQDKEALVLLISSRQAAITDIVRHELLVGTSSDSQFKEMKSRLSVLKEFRLTEPLQDDFNRFGYELGRIGLLGRYTDAAIAFLSRTHDAPVYSFDGYFQKLAKKRLISSFRVS
jgi:predicted nucleic acid-binding protein